MVSKAVAQVENISRNDAAGLIASQPDPFAYSINYIRIYPIVFNKKQVYGIVRTILGSDYNTWSLLWRVMIFKRRGFYLSCLAAEG